MASPQVWILVTGGAGFIGSHTVVELCTAGFAVVILDSLQNSSAISLDRIRLLVPRPDLVEFVQADILDDKAVGEICRLKKFSSVIHFAALKAVGESVADPLAYYRNNITGLLTLLQHVVAVGIPSIVFSSSATVYGDGIPPFTELSPTGTGITNPYGQTKFMAEQILSDLQKATPSLRVSLLRYFNPVGAHESGTMGEDPAGVPSNLMPYIQRVATGRLPKLTVYGGDYATPDGTALRDYIHVVDLAKGHVKALEWMAKQTSGFCEVFNLGTGRPSSVLEVISSFRAASGHPIPITVGPRRPGDAPSSFAEPSKAKEVLGWEASLTMTDMCRDSWRWVSLNPMGYAPLAVSLTEKLA